jgi:hypothetical protein
MSRPNILLTFMLLYGAASLAHFLHNAVYLDVYPNLPPWLTPLGVLASWLVIAGIGAAGYWLFCKISPPVGLTIIALYAALGFAGLDHYTLAPASAHSWAMNATIAGEAIAASALLVVIAWTATRRSPVAAD